MIMKYIVEANMQAVQNKPRQFANIDTRNTSM